MASTSSTPTPWLTRWRRRPSPAATDWADMGTCIGLDAAQPVAVEAPEPAEPLERKDRSAHPAPSLPMVSKAVAPVAPGQAPSTSPWWGRWQSLNRGSRGG